MATCCTNGVRSQIDGLLTMIKMLVALCLSVLVNDFHQVLQCSVTGADLGREPPPPLSSGNHSEKGKILLQNQTFCFLRKCRKCHFRDSRCSKSSGGNTPAPPPPAGLGLRVIYIPYNHIMTPFTASNVQTNHQAICHMT